MTILKKMLNCLSYALQFWKKCPEYRIYYNSNHCINIPEETKIEGFLPIEEFGFEYFYKWFEQGLINQEDLNLLVSYFVKDVRKC